jgi:PRD1 phage membrane DNA delivery
MINQFGNIIFSIVVVAGLSVAASRKSNTAGILKAGFGGFGQALKDAGQAGR